MEALHDTVDNASAHFVYQEKNHSLFPCNRPQVSDLVYISWFRAWLRALDELLAAAATVRRASAHERAWLGGSLASWRRARRARAAARGAAAAPRKA